MRRYKNITKRFIDIILSFLGLLFLSPLFFLIALLIKVNSKGPIFFTQDRLGKNGHIFKIMKFRTMVNNAEKMGSGLSTYEGDPRITKVGKYLRKTSLDELPQLINVLNGKMSIIGPRPPVPYHPKKYSEYDVEEAKRFNVSPGITGYAQIKGRNSLTWDERIKYDVEYVENYSLLLDFKITCITFLKVFKSEDIHGPTRRKSE